MAAIEVVGVRDQEVRRRTLVLGQTDETFRIGNVTIQPSELLVVWTRERIISAAFTTQKSGTQWRMISLTVVGPRVAAGEVRHDEKPREFRFDRPADAPKWMTTLANRHIPSDQFE